MRQKRCRCCRGLYLPRPQSYRQQKTCGRPACRVWRICQALAAWRLKNPLYGESRKGKLAVWRQNHRGYWNRWRKGHPGYVARNRRAQRQRNAKNRGLIAKRNGWNAIPLEKLERIGSLGVIAKRNGCNEISLRQIDGILGYLKGQVLIAKRNDIDRRL